MLCLGIETTCDETGLALVKDGELLEAVLASQAKLHSLFGGVVPELASREHYHYIGALFDELIRRADINFNAIDFIAVARGPGLLGSLLVGMAFAKGLALGLGRPLLGINHLHAHLLANGLSQKLEYPALGLLASGGHTELYRIESPCEFVRLGRALDDAAGEAFDKTGKALGFPYPGGKFVDEMAGKGAINPTLFPKPFLNNDNLDFSFSGLKTAVATLIGAKGDVGIADREKENLCASFNYAVAVTLKKKMERALRLSKDIRQLWVAGGVAANSMLRCELQNLARKHSLPLLVPEPEYCCDNGAMIAYAGCLAAREGYFHTLELESVPRGRKIPDDMLNMRQNAALSN